MPRGKAQLELSKGSVWCFEQILVAASNKTKAEQSRIPVPQPIKVWLKRYAGHYWRSKDEHRSNVHQWTSKYGHTRVCQRLNNYIDQLCANTWYCLEDLPKVMTNKDIWPKREGRQKVIDILMMRRRMSRSRSKVLIEK